MAIRLPLKRVASFSDDNDTGTGSVGGAIMHTFQLPQDTDNVVLKLTASVAGTGLSAILQTTDDAGTTYYDCGQTSIVSNATNAGAEWLSIPTIGYGDGTATSLGSTMDTTTGLPILSQQARVAIVLAGDVISAASNTCDVVVMTNNQSATS